MKRLCIAFMVLGLVAGSVATAEAGKKTKKSVRSERTVTENYARQFVPFGSVVTGPCTESGEHGCVKIRTAASESYFMAEVSDTHGQPVMVTVTSPASNTQWVEYGTFCGETEKPIFFDPGVDLVLHIGYWDPYLPTDAPSCPPAFGTTGTISVTLSNVP